MHAGAKGAPTCSRGTYMQQIRGTYMLQGQKGHLHAAGAAPGQGHLHAAG